MSGQSVRKRSAHRSERLLSRKPEFKGQDSLMKKKRATVCGSCADPVRFVQEACLRRVVNSVINQVVRLEARGG